MPMQQQLLRTILFFYLAQSLHFAAGRNPFTPQAHLVRYWNNKIYKIPHPEFLIAKASPLSAVDSASFAQLADKNALSTHLDSFCKKANLLCFPDPSPNLEKHSSDVHFSHYADQNFTNYGTDRAGGFDSFKKYSGDENIPLDTFRRYSRDSTGHSDQFITYVPNGNVASQTFNTYGTGATGGVGQFKHYADSVNVPDLQFTSYSAEGNGRQQSFSAYSDDGNAGDQKFASYGKDGNGLTNSFTTYGNNSNVASSGFSSYGESGNGGGDTFTTYSQSENVGENTFKNYADGGNDITETFSSYRDQANVGDDSFQSYAKKSNSADVKFSAYGQSFNEGSDKFTGYGKGAKGQSVDFKTYGVNNTFKDYTKNGVTFSDYRNTSTAAQLATSTSKVVNKWIEPGKFFREENLKTGTVMPMPDIKDKMPARSFLPRSLLSKLPFSSSKISELKQIFHAFDNSSMETILNAAVHECERAPSPGETKRCVGSAEDMIDFAVSVLGNSVELRTTESTKGSKNQIMIGKVRGINGGKVTHSVSCHQSLYPYLLYYCHSVPKVRVYEAEILDPNAKSRINRGVAICHLDTSAWSATHGAFIALGSGPGKIEVCHWIFENDLTWTIADW
ncbi:hypothetical protein V2J09_015433 [Rumex salicifolius]